MRKQETMADFKHRIAHQKRNAEGGAIYSVIGASRPDERLTGAWIETPTACHLVGKPANKKEKDGLLRVHQV